MEMGHEFDEPRLGPAARERFAPFAGPWAAGDEPAARGLDLTPPDWPALRARFAALHALRQSFESHADSALVAGGFARAGEAVLASCRAGRLAVNPVCSAYGKADQGMTEAVAASHMPGDRGME